MAREHAYTELVKAATAAVHALRSYQYGNDSTELAEEIADALEAALNNADIVKPPETAPVGGKA
jgi:hypothetical protein